MNNSQQAISKSCKQDTWLIGLSLSILETFPLFSSSMIHSYDFFAHIPNINGCLVKKLEFGSQVLCNSLYPFHFTR